jgi:excinuclease UvrABC helicase subunit UvrB
MSAAERDRMIETLTKEMKSAAAKLEFEQAAFLRDRTRQLREGKNI